MKWAKKYISIYNQPLDNVHEGIIQEIKQKLAKVQSDEPVVTVSVIAYNEERHLLPCLWALSEMRCEYPVEIIGVNNDSSDRTGEIFRLVGLPHYLEKRHSCGYARQCGLDHARGRYHINIDADTMYPPLYVQILVDHLRIPGNVACCSSWSYIPDERHSRLLRVVTGYLSILSIIQAPGTKRKRARFRLSYRAGPENRDSGRYKKRRRRYISHASKRSR